MDSLLKYVACPRCKNDLIYDKESFVCKNCENKYPVIDGIPRFIPDISKSLLEETRKSFNLQWEMSRARGEYNQFNPDYRKKLVPYLLDDTMLPADYFKDKVVLDAGCGIGRLSYALAELGAEVVSMDYNDNAVRIAHEYFKDNPKVSVIQADILNPPLKPGSFDFIISFGVLHHTGNSKAAFDQCVPLVKNGGIFFVMLYEKYNRFKIWFTNQFRKITLRIDKERLYKLCIQMSKVCKYGIFRIPLKPFIDIGYSAEGNYDAFAKAINQHHTAEEVFGWYQRAGFGEMTLNASRRFKNPLFIFLQGRWGGTVRMRGTKLCNIIGSKEILHYINNGTRRHI